MTNMKKAFTIVELLVVMAVIGILISLAVVGIQAVQRSQRETTRLNDIRNLEAKLAEYYTKYRVYPYINFNDDPLSDIKVDSTPPDVGICLFVPGNGDGSDCDVNASSSAIFSSIKMSFGVTLDYESLASYDSFTCGDGTYGTSEVFNIYYGHRNVSTPQQYALFGCLESGKTINFGTLTSTL